MPSKRRTGMKIPEAIAKPAPANKGRRTAAFSASDPSVRERLGRPAPRGAAAAEATDRKSVPATAPVADLRIAGRFELRARGAGMVCHDVKTERDVPFPKAATGIVQDLLAGLFGRPSRAKSAKGPKGTDASGLPDRFDDAKLGLVLRRVEVRVDPLHPTQVLPGDDGDGMSLQAYSVRLGRKTFGHVLVSGPTRFQVSVPQLQQKITAHTSLEAAVDRVKLVAETYLERKGAAKSKG